MKNFIAGLTMALSMISVYAEQGSNFSQYPADKWIRCVHDNGFEGRLEIMVSPELPDRQRFVGIARYYYGLAGIGRMKCATEPLLLGVETDNGMELLPDERIKTSATYDSFVANSGASAININGKRHGLTCWAANLPFFKKEIIAKRTYKYKKYGTDEAFKWACHHENEKRLEILDFL